MRIGLDIDDTICDTFDFLLPYICKYYKLDYEKTKKRNLSYDYFLDHYDDYFIFAKLNYKNIIPHVPLKKGVIKYLTKLRKKGHQIVFITARSDRGYDNPYQLTYDYLALNGIPFDTLITSAGDKAGSCKEEQIDLFIDDSIDNCKSLSSHNIQVLLFKAAWNKKCKEFKKVKSFKNLYKIVKGGKYGR